MKLHRFYVGDVIELKHDFWVHDPGLMRQLNDNLGLKAGEDIVLCNDSHDRLYKIVELKSNEAHLQHVTDLKRKGRP